MKIKKSVKLVILCTHPIQYYSPWFRYLAEQAPRLGLAPPDLPPPILKSRSAVDSFSASAGELGISDMGYGSRIRWKDDD